MKATVFSHSDLIGTTALQIGDESMGALFGSFAPTRYYVDNIQPTVWKFWQSNKPDYRKWDVLRINVQLENGIFLFPQGGYTIDDVKELATAPKRIDIAGVDSKVLQAFSFTRPPGSFVQKPWHALRIEQKIAFEDELKKELGLNKSSVFDFTEKHFLYNSKFSAIAHDQSNDDVLFEISKQGFEKRFAVVHLTWTGKKERKGYPFMTFYETFDDFKFSKMSVAITDRED